MNLMPATHTHLYQKLVQAVLYKKLSRVSVNLGYKFFFWYAFLARSRTRLYCSTENVWHMTRTVQRDWLNSCFGARNCDELASYFFVQVNGTSFWYKFLERVSSALFSTMLQSCECMCVLVLSVHTACGTVVACSSCMVCICWPKHRQSLNAS